MGENESESRESKGGSGEVGNGADRRAVRGREGALEEGKGRRGEIGERSPHLVRILGLGFRRERGKRGSRQRWRAAVEPRSLTVTEASIGERNGSGDEMPTYIFR